MNEDRFKLYGAVFLVLKKGNSVLLQRRYKTGHEDGKYGIVSGHLDGNQSARETIVREAYEEAGIRISINQLRFIHAMHIITNKEYLNLYFTVDSWQGEIKNMEPHKCDDLSWHRLDELPYNTIEYIKLALHSIKHGILYSEFGF